MACIYSSCRGLAVTTDSVLYLSSYCSQSSLQSLVSVSLTLCCIGFHAFLFLAFLNSFSWSPTSNTFFSKNNKWKEICICCILENVSILTFPLDFYDCKPLQCDTETADFWSYAIYRYLFLGAFSSRHFLNFYYFYPYLVLYSLCWNSTDPLLELVKWLSEICASSVSPLLNIAFECRSFWESFLTLTEGHMSFTPLSFLLLKVAIMPWVARTKNHLNTRMKSNFKIYKTVPKHTTRMLQIFVKCKREWIVTVSIEGQSLRLFRALLPLH